MIRRVKEIARKSMLLRRVVRERRLRHGQPRWDSVLTSDWPSVVAAASGKRVLLATGTGGHLAGTTMESLLGAALTLRGARVDVLLCDGALPACLLCWVGFDTDAAPFVRSGPGICGDCHGPAERMYRGLGFTCLRYGDHLAPPEIEAAGRIARETPFDQIPSLVVDGVAVGEHALAGALRFYARGDLEGEPLAEPVLRRYLEAALRAACVMRRVLSSADYDCVVFHHGIYVPQGIVGDVCRGMGVRVVNWTPAYRRQTFIFSHGDTYHQTMVSEPVSEWSDLPWDDGLREELLSYLKARWTGGEDWIWFHQDPRFDMRAFEARSGLDGRPRIGLLTSVMWDAKLHYPANAFPSMLDCIVETVHWFEKRPDLQLVIRVHPAELRGTLPARQRLGDEISRIFPRLPENVLLVGPEDPISTYALIDTCDSVIVYNTKTGIEAAAVGIPVIVAGEAWVRNKGFAWEASSADSYFHLLDRLPVGQRLRGRELELAEKYAYHFFFRRMIPVKVVEPTGGDPPYRLSVCGIAELREGVDLGLDVICRGILEGTSFVYPAEAMQTAGAG